MLFLLIVCIVWWNVMMCVWLQQWSVELLCGGLGSVWAGLQTCRSSSWQRRPLQAVGWCTSCLQTLQWAVSEVPCCVCVHQSVYAMRIYLIVCFSFVMFSFVSLPLYSFSISAFDSLIIVGTNNISEQSMAELNKKVNWLMNVRIVYDEVHCAAVSPNVLCVIVSGESDRCGRCWNTSGHMHQTAFAGLCV